MSPILAILIVWIVVIPAAVCAFAGLYPVFAGRRIAAARELIERRRCEGRPEPSGAARRSTRRFVRSTARPTH